MYPRLILNKGRCLLILSFVGGCAFSDGPYELVSGNPMPLDRLNRIKVQHASTELVRHELGTPDKILRDGRTERWLFKNEYRATSTNTVFFVERTSCHFSRNTYTVTFEDGHAAKVDSKSDAWVAQDRDCDR